jgi:hypothetical protein
VDGFLVRFGHPAPNSVLDQEQYTVFRKNQGDKSVRVKLYLTKFDAVELLL